MGLGLWVRKGGGLAGWWVREMWIGVRWGGGSDDDGGGAWGGLWGGGMGGEAGRGGGKGKCDAVGGWLIGEASADLSEMQGLGNWAAPHAGTVASPVSWGNFLGEG